MKLPSLPKKHLLMLWVIVFFAFFSRLWRVTFPALPYFDEAYHVPASRLISRSDPRAYEWWHEPIAGDDYHDWLHPPLAKLIQAGSINLFGDNSWGWRVSSVIAGSLMVFVIYFLAREIFQVVFSQKKTKSIALLVAALLSLDGLPLVQSRIAMNDVFVSLFVLLALFFVTRWQPKIWLFKIGRFKQEKGFLARYSKLNLLFGGICLGLGLASKWSALLLLVFLLVQVFLGIMVNKTWRLLPFAIFSLIILPVAMYLASYTQMFLQGKNFNYFIELHQQIIWYQKNRDDIHQYASSPLAWLFNAKPVWYWAESSAESNDAGLVGNIYALGNPVIHVLVIVALIYQLGILVVNWNNNEKLCFRISLLSLYLFLWLPWFFSPRIIFYHLYLPANCILMMILGEFLVVQVKPRSKCLFWLVLCLFFGSYLFFYPHWTGMLVPKNLANRFYFAFPSWR